MRSRRIVSLLAVAALATTMFVGCGSNEAKESGLKNGTYKAESEKDAKGYVASIEIEVKDGKIATAKYAETSEDGVNKADNEEYSTKMKDKSGITPKEAYATLEAALVEKQDVAAVDTVTGATSSAEKFKTLAEEALKSAK